MPKYLVKVTCYGFKGRMWDAGQIVDLRDDEYPPKHFERLDKGIIKKPVEPDTGHVPLSTVGIPPSPDHGFGNNAAKPNMLRQKTAAEVLKDHPGNPEPKAQKTERVK